MKMPMFITYASYSHAGVKGIISDPVDRTAAIKGLVEKAGGRLIAAYMTTGTNDIVLVTEVADGSDAVAAGMAAAASGHYQRWKRCALGRSPSLHKSRKRLVGLLRPSSRLGHKRFWGTQAKS